MRKPKKENATGLASHKTEIYICNQTHTKTYYWEQSVTFKSDVFEWGNLQGKGLIQDRKI